MAVPCPSFSAPPAPSYSSPAASATAIDGGAAENEQLAEERMREEVKRLQEEEPASRLVAQDMVIENAQTHVIHTDAFAFIPRNTGLIKIIQKHLFPRNFPLHRAITIHKTYMRTHTFVTRNKRAHSTRRHLFLYQTLYLPLYRPLDCT